MQSCTPLWAFRGGRGGRRERGSRPNCTRVCKMAGYAQFFLHHISIAAGANLPPSQDTSSHGPVVDGDTIIVFGFSTSKNRLLRFHTWGAFGLNRTMVSRFVKRKSEAHG